jgi:Lipopolysaccharide-assembly
MHRKASELPRARSAVLPSDASPPVGGGERCAHGAAPSFASPTGAKLGAYGAPRLILLVLLCILPSCGYSLVGKGITTDPSIKRIGVPLFKDRTAQPGLDQKLTNQVIAELLKRGRFDVVPETEGVDAVVDGEILTYHTAPIGFSTADGGTTQASRFAVSITVKVVYRKVGAEEPIWSSDNFPAREEAEITDEATNYFDRVPQVWDRLAEAFARNLTAAMLEAF